MQGRDLVQGYCFSPYFFRDSATTEIYTLSLHDALPISLDPAYAQEVLTPGVCQQLTALASGQVGVNLSIEDRKSTRLNSSHPSISYAVFCLKKKKKS